MADGLVVLLDQNVPRVVAEWLRQHRPTWTVHHTSEVGLNKLPDAEVFRWAQKHRALIVTFDEDFADQRAFPVGRHHGVIRLRVWPTTIEEAESGLGRLLGEVRDEDLQGALVIIDRNRIRVRRPGM